MWPNEGFIKLRRVRSERSSDIQWMKQHERCQPNSGFWTKLEAQRTNATSQTINASQTINGAQQKCTRARDTTRKHLTSPWPRGKCARFGAGGSRVRLSAGSYQDLVNWYFGLLTRRTVYGKSCRELTQNIKTSRVKMKPEIVHNSVVALQDHGSYKAPTTNHHIKQTNKKTK